MIRRAVERINLRRLDRGQRIHFFTNIAIGTLIAVLFHFVEHTDWGERLLNSFFDPLIRFEKYSMKQNDRLFFIDIDHETYKQWGENSMTPRGKLAQLIEYAHRGGAKLVILDILLEDHDCHDPQGEEQLGQFLTKLTQQKDPIDIIFPVRIGSEGVLKINIFDSLIDSNPHFHRGVPMFSSTAGDLIYRYWNVFVNAKNRSGKEVIVWSLPVLSALLSEGRPDIIEMLTTKFSDREGLGQKGHNAAEIVMTVRGVKMLIPLDDGDLFLRRIRFFFIPGINILKQVVSAQDVKAPDDEAAKMIFLKQFDNKIVIIGNSSPDMGDLHKTPVGMMPGIYIIGNALNTIIEGVQPSRSHWTINILIEIIGITIAAYFFLYFGSSNAKLLATFLLLVLIGPFTLYFYFKHGVFLNLIFSVVGIGFHDTFSAIEAFFRKKH